MYFPVILSEVTEDHEAEESVSLAKRGADPSTSLRSAQDDIL